MLHTSATQNDKRTSGAYNALQVNVQDAGGKKGSTLQKQDSLVREARTRRFTIAMRTRVR